MCLQGDYCLYADKISVNDIKELMSNHILIKSKYLVKRRGYRPILFFAGILAVALGLFFWQSNTRSKPTSESLATTSIYEMDYSVSALDDSNTSTTIKFGHALFNNSPKYLGANGKQYSGNGLSCTNCHLNGGTKPYAAPLIGVVQRFPQFRGRENKVGTIEERINGCMERSMNGRAMPVDSSEMLALVSYLAWLGRYAPSNGRIAGEGFASINLPNRPVDLSHGQEIFAGRCMVCHGENGQGKDSDDGQTYQYPPLWGSDSYNNGAGMARVITAAQFIKFNMPFGATYENPILTDEEAYDVAGYINQQTRPVKPNLDRDFPDRKTKPVSTPYPPFADPFPLEQHQRGPFQPIMEFYAKTYEIRKAK